MNPSDNPVNNRELQRLADLARNEDQPTEEGPGGPAPEVETVADQQAAAEAAARKMAGGMVSGLTMAVRTFWGVEYGDQLKAEAVDKLAPCFLGAGEPPAWLTTILGRYGHYIDAGAFIASVGYSTYVQVQEREQKEKADRERNSYTTEPEAGATEPASAVYGIDGEREK